MQGNFLTFLKLWYSVMRCPLDGGGKEINTNIFIYI